MRMVFIRKTPPPCSHRWRRKSWWEKTLASHTLEPHVHSLRLEMASQTQLSLSWLVPDINIHSSVGIIVIILILLQNNSNPVRHNCNGLKQRKETKVHISFILSFLLFCSLKFKLNKPSGCSAVGRQVVSESVFTSLQFRHVYKENIMEHVGSIIQFSNVKILSQV